MDYGDRSVTARVIAPQTDAANQLDVFNVTLVGQGKTAISL
jgi:hypothetical protein